MPITVSNRQGNISTTQNASTTIFWEWLPSPIFKRVWKVGTPFANSSLIKVKLPAYELMSYYSGFTAFQLDVSVNCGSATQWVQVEGQNTYSGTIGNQITENSLTFYLKELNFNFVNFNLLSVGTYFATANYRITAINPNTQAREEIITQGMYFQLEVVNTDVEFLAYSWNVALMNYLYFSYYSGGDLPISQNVSVYHNVPFTVSVSDPLLLYNVTADTNFSILELSFAAGISSLAVGIHNFQVTLHYGTGLTKVIDIQLEVLTDPAGFYVNPDTVVFEVYRNATLPDPVMINTMSPTPWNINQLPVWLQVSQNQGNGITDVFLQASGYNSLPAGEYNFDLEFTNSTQTKEVAVKLILHDFLSHPFEPGKLYFTEALDYLEFNSDEPEATFIDIVLNVKAFTLNLYEEVSYIRNYRLPLYKGQGEFHIGSVAHQLMEEVKLLEDVVPVFEGNYSKTQYCPVEVSVAYSQKLYSTGAEIRSGVIDLIKFIKGNSPYLTDGQLSLLTVQQQNFSRITPKSVVGIGFTHLGNPIVKVIKNGLPVSEENVLVFSSDPERIIYSYYRFSNDLQPGDTLELQISNNFESRIQRYHVFPEGLESTYFLFENDNGIIEPFEFTGRVRVNSGYKHVTTKVFKNLFEIDKKVTSGNDQSMIVNTGQLLPSDHKIIDAIIRSEKVWCAFNDPSGDYFLVDATTTKMTPSDTFKEDNSFDVEFNILENADVTVYPR